MAGILSSLLALRFGAPLLLVFLLIGMLAGDSGPGRLQFDDVRSTYLVGSVALALILFDGGLKTRFQSIRTVLAPSMVLATIGVLLTALITAPVAKYALDLNWTEACWLVRWWHRPTRRRCFCWCTRRVCGCVPVSARRWKPSPAPTIRSRCS